MIKNLLGTSEIISAKQQLKSAELNQGHTKFTRSVINLIKDVSKTPLSTQELLEAHLSTPCMLQDISKTNLDFRQKMQEMQTRLADPKIREAAEKELAQGNPNFVNTATLRPH